MKIAQYYEGSRIRLGQIDNGNLYPTDFDGDMIDFLNGKRDYNTSGISVPIENVEFAAPVSRPTKIMAIGLNYKDHIKESKGEMPDVPLVFAKFPNSLTGHNKSIIWDPSLVKKVDFEAELAVIIGKTIHNCTDKEAMTAVFGYTCGNDVSARDLQFGDGQWVRGKSLDTFCPLGPWIVSADEIDDPNSLDIRCLLNGETMQKSNTGMMIFRLPQLISFLSRYFTLNPGDIIMTGTPHGVGAFREPSVYMKDNDEVIVEIEGIGRLRNICRQVLL
ncbi:MAG: fumarylacetoacetate hydrolase family protein [Deltaproteobacteria bacterium]|nr:fumarylacetoacetate hydrolase family protein [Deltaproteobacteria bacterium]